MGNKLFQEGGPHDIKQIGPDEYTFNVALPKDSDGLVARECPAESCSPGYFKVKPGTGITNGQEYAFCPYCRFKGDPREFTTKEQVRYAKDILEREALEGVDRIFKDALGFDSSGKKIMGGGFFSIEMSFKAPHKRPLMRPFEEEVRRDVICPNCGLDHSVYGLATWCADCGEDIFLVHIQAELNVVRTMLSDIERRRESFGHRVAAKDIENCIEDTVSIFEAVLRAEVRRHLLESKKSTEEIEQFFKKIRNAFQNPRRAEEIFTKEFDVPLLSSLSETEADLLIRIFEKRHPIAHNLGVVDKKYIERARTDEMEGKEILVESDEIESAIGLSIRIFQDIHSRMFGGNKNL